jgi:flagellar protein FlaG
MDVSTINGLTQGIVTVPQTDSVITTPTLEVEHRRALIQAVRAVNGAELYGQQNELSFAFDRATQRAVVRIVDKKTREVVQQIPTEQVLRMAEEVQERE